MKYSYQGKNQTDCNNITTHHIPEAFFHPSPIIIFFNITGLLQCTICCVIIVFILFDIYFSFQYTENMMLYISLKILAQC